MGYYFRLPNINQLTIPQQAAVNETRSIKIVGGPGTGKSVVSLWRHIRNHSLNLRSSLLLTYTKTLATFLSATARSANSVAGNHVNRTLWWATHNGESYDEIIVDEAQDVELDRYNILRAKSKSVSYGVDEDQSLYLSRQDLTQLIHGLKQMFPSNIVYDFDVNFRNTKEIIQFVRALFPNKRVPRSEISVVKPKVLIHQNNRNQADAGICGLINQYRSDTHNIAIFVPTINDINYYHNVLSNSEIKHSFYCHTNEGIEQIENVHLTTFKSSKGTEFDSVIIPDFEKMLSNIARLNVVNENDYYVALTRSRRNLFLFCNNHPEFLRRSATQLSTYEIENL